MRHASVLCASALFLVLCLLQSNASDGGKNEFTKSTDIVANSSNRQRPLHISIETWRWLPHSYAIIGMNLALTLRKMQLRGGEGKVRVSLVDAAPLHNQVIDWRSKKDYGLFSEENSRLLSAIPQTRSLPYADSEVPDVVFKIAYPFNTSTGGLNHQHSDLQTSGRPLIFTYGTVEKKHCPPDMLTDDSPPWPDVQVRMITPSAWSAAGLEACGVPSDKIDVVPNGYDPEVFYAPSTFERRKAYVFTHKHSIRVCRRPVRLLFERLSVACNVWVAQTNEGNVCFLSCLCLRSFPSRAHFGFSEHDVVFFAIGAMTSNKGITNVIRSFVKVFELHPGWFIIVVGCHPTNSP